MGYVKKIIDKLLRLQQRFIPEVQEYADQVEARVSLLKVTGIDGENVLLKYNRGRLDYATGNEKPVHVFRTMSDTFLSILIGDEELREAITKDRFVIEDAATATINVVECEKWAKAFNNLKGMLRTYIGV